MKITFSNKILLALVILLYGFSLLGLPDMSSYAAGQVVGALLAAILFPLAIAWIAWRLAKRNPRVGSIVCNVLLVIALMAQVNKIGKQAKVLQAERENAQQRTEFKEAVLHSSSPEDLNAAYQKRAESFAGYMDELSANGTKSAQEVSEVVKSFLSDSETLAEEWMHSFGAIRDERILDIARLHEKGEITFQKRVVQQYIDKTAEYREFYAGLLESFDKRLEGFPQDDEFAEGVRRGFRDRYQSESPLLRSILKAHDQYGRGMLELLEFLEEHDGDWEFVGEELVFSDESDRVIFDGLVAELSEMEMDLSSLAEEYADSL